MRFLSLIYIFGAFVSPIIANTVPNAEEVVDDTPGPSLRGAGHEVNEPGDPTTDFFRRRTPLEELEEHPASPSGSNAKKIDSEISVPSFCAHGHIFPEPHCQEHVQWRKGAGLSSLVLCVAQTSRISHSSPPRLVVSTVPMSRYSTHSMAGIITSSFWHDEQVTMAFRLFLLHRSRQKAPEMGQALGYVVR
ncbi:hypothetical protein E4U19_007030 [Claviceps sp. Clav32 group G5]|nr:hypothetical protein E4U19_007030 [Claviceps sp. Clav32 group G5]